MKMKQVEAAVVSAGILSGRRQTKPPSTVEFLIGRPYRLPKGAAEAAEAAAAEPALPSAEGP